MSGPDWATARATGLAQHLAAAGICTWNPDGLYTPGQVGAFVGLMPDEPSDAIGIIATPLAPARGVTQLRAQIRVRRDSPDPRDTNRLAQDVVDALHEAHDLDLDGIPVPLLLLQSWADLGYDQAGRPEISLNFYGYTAYTTPAFRD